MYSKDALRLLFITKNQKLNTLISEILIETLPRVVMSSSLDYSMLPTVSNLSLAIIDYKTTPLSTSKIYTPKSTPYPWLIINTNQDFELSSQLIEQGYCGEIYHKQIIEQITKAVKSILCGELWFSRHTLSKALKESVKPAFEVAFICQKYAYHYDLTKKEIQICKLLIQNNTNIQISERCFISQNTVKTHLSNIYRKLNVHSRRDVLILFQTLPH